MIRATETQQTSTPTQKYPYLGEWIRNDKQARSIVLFSAPNTGVIVFSEGDNGNTHQFGEYSEDWYEAGFTEYTGTIHLSNA